MPLPLCEPAARTTLLAMGIVAGGERNNAGSFNCRRCWPLEGEKNCIHEILTSCDTRRLPSLALLAGRGQEQEAFVVDLAWAAAEGDRPAVELQGWDDSAAEFPARPLSQATCFSPAIPTAPT